MSLILDALRKSAHDGAKVARGPRVDAVLATLGYPRRSGGRTSSRRKALGYGVLALVLGFIGVAIPVLLMTPRAPRPDATLIAPASPAPPVAPAAGSAGRQSRPPAALHPRALLRMTSASSRNNDTPETA